MNKTIPERFKHQDFEKKWQKWWEEKKIYSPDFKKAKKPYYNLMMFPYPSAEGLHIGNMYAFTGVDVFGRFKRMQGYDVFEPIGLDGFGIHSENYAIKVNKHPKEQAKISAANFYRQLRAIGNSFDWTRTLETYDPDYYRWTQWLFVQMFKHGLAYRAKAAVNYCPSCKTVLADEQVIQMQKSKCKMQNENLKVKNIRENQLPDQRKSEKDLEKETYQGCERCGTEVVIKELEQWFFRITSYAEKLLQNTYKPTFNWSEKVKVGQRNWIGKKEGINIKYQIITNNPISTNKYQYEVEVFTTRPDTNFGATFIVLAPEHPIVTSLLKSKIKDQRSKIEEIKSYLDKVSNLSHDERLSQKKKKTGVFTGLYCINQLNNYKMPLYISDYVLMEFGTGAVVGVPGHDVRDFEFAKEFNLPIVRVVVGKDGDRSDITQIEQVQEEEGMMVNSGFLDGLDIHNATQKIMDYMEEKGWGKRVTTYHLRDWLISRQRYWGAPIPMIFCEACKKKGLSWFDTEENSPSPSLAKRGSYHQQDGEVPPLGKRGSGGVADQMFGWYPIPEKDLPVLLPDVEDWRPTGTGRGPLAAHPEFYKTVCPNCGNPATRETDVCDTFLDSAWYYLRYPFVGQKENSPLPSLAKRGDNYKENGVVPPLGKRGSGGVLDATKLPWNNEITQCWMPVDSYIGGAEHTVLHLLYTRFVWMAFRDWKYLEVKDPKDNEYDPNEPFKRFFAHGLIIKDGAKMSKSKGNVVIPDDYISLYGADTLRTYLMFLGPFDSGGDFRDTGITGMFKWLSRVWRLVNEFAKTGNEKSQTESTEAQKMISFTIKKVTCDLENLRYNTAIAHLMEFTNWWMDHQEQIVSKTIIDFLKLLAPFAPFMTEELYSRLSVISTQYSDSSSSVIGLSVKKTSNQSTDNRQLKTDNWSIHVQPWPTYDETLLVEDKLTVVVQINGKLRDSLSIDAKKANNKEAIEQEALMSAKVQKWLGNAIVIKKIFIPGKLINFVI